MPVFLSGSLVYADSLTWTVTYNCSYIPCSQTLPAQYETSNGTFCSSPSVDFCVPPAMLDPNRPNDTAIFGGTNRGSHGNFLPPNVISDMERSQKFNANKWSFWSTSGYFGYFGPDSNIPWMANSFNRVMTGKLIRLNHMQKQELISMCRL